MCFKGLMPSKMHLTSIEIHARTMAFFCISICVIYVILSHSIPILRPECLTCAGERFGRSKKKVQPQSKLQQLHTYHRSIPRFLHVICRILVSERPLNLHLRKQKKNSSSILPATTICSLWVSGFIWGVP